MLEFTGGEWFNISGRGNVYSCKMPVDFHDSLMDMEVKIEGNTYVIIGVELHAVRDRFLRKGRSVGLLIRGPRKEDEGFTPYPC